MLTTLIFISMNKNKTKDKGDIGVAMVISDLTKRGYKVALPISEHLPFDLIAISSSCQLARVSVKYSGNTDAAKISLRSISSNSKDYIVTRVDINDIDGFAVYSPITSECYYVNKNKMIGKKSQIGLRISETTCTNIGQILFAKDYKNPECLFDENKKED